MGFLKNPVGKTGLGPIGPTKRPAHFWLVRVGVLRPLSAIIVLIRTRAIAGREMGDRHVAHCSGGK